MSRIRRPVKSLISLDECDPNSQDSGYGPGLPNKDEKMKCQAGFRFADRLGLASPERSPMKSPAVGSKRTLSTNLSSRSDIDDGFAESLDMDSLDDTAKFPSRLSSLLSGMIMSSEETTNFLESTLEKKSRPSCRRSPFRKNENATPPSSRARHCLFRSPGAQSSTTRLSSNDNLRPDSSAASLPKSIERLEQASNIGSESLKKGGKLMSLDDLSPLTCIKNQPFLRRFSDTEARIKSAVHRSTTGANLTGDFSKQCILPLVQGQQEDMMLISSETLAALMRGVFGDSVSSFNIVDCRYPYEYEAGHIEGALNLYTKDMIEQQLLSSLTRTPEIQLDTTKRDIIIFHCELSWERGPFLSRYLRSTDRNRNQENYPALHYPELYVLHGGYQRFYNRHKELCSPQGYKPMRHPDHVAEMRQFRSKTKILQSNRPKFPVDTKRKRLGL